MTARIKNGGAQRIPLFPLAFALVIFAIATVWFVRFQNQTQQPIQLAKENARQSSAIDKMVGQPFTSGRFASGDLISSGGNGNADLTISIYGPHGRGTLLEWAQEVEGRWKICSLDFRPSDGSAMIEVVPDAWSTCERE